MVVGHQLGRGDFVAVAVVFVVVSAESALLWKSVAT
jgi:hypothetical protein